jgi:methionyl-tRNA formyltransferase
VRAIFCGTPEIAVPSLEALAEIAEIVGVVCQPDRPAGRGMHLRSPAVKTRALELGLDVYQPLKVRDGSLAVWMREKRADLALVIAYGRILTEETLTAPRLGCVNLHASILPEFRGAAPIQRALLAGKTETGVCLMQMDQGMDTGDILACHKLPIAAEDDAGTLAARLGALAATITKEELPRFFRGELTPRKQDESRATYAPPLTKEDSEPRFNRTPEEVVGQIRGLSPRPGVSASVTREGAPRKQLKILLGKIWETSESLDPGRVLWAGKHLLVGTAGLPVEVLLAQPEGKKPQGAADLRNGRVLVDGDVLV